MGYYLSKEHRAILEMFVDTFQTKSSEFVVRLTNQQKFLTVLANSSATTEFRWIKRKWKWYLASDGNIVFTPRSIDDFQIIDPDPPTITESVDLFGVMNVLLLDQPEHIVFTDCVLTAEEASRLDMYCRERKLDMYYNPDSKRLAIIRKNA